MAVMAYSMQSSGESTRPRTTMSEESEVKTASEPHQRGKGENRMEGA